MKQFIMSILASGLVFWCAACNMSVNKSIDIRSGERREGGVHTVNGSITIGDECIINGPCRTVNGGITAGSHCRLKDLDTVNSGIAIGSNTEIDGDVETVNGSLELDENIRVNGGLSTTNGDITCQKGVEINQNVRNVNGDIHLEKTIVRGDLKTHTGDIRLAGGSQIHGDIIIGHSSGFFGSKKDIHIYIDGDSIVKGAVNVKTRKFNVTVHLAKGGQIIGPIQGDVKIERE